jgi:uncharacterized protein (TIRG00374 family)
VSALASLLGPRGVKGLVFSALAAGVAYLGFSLWAGWRDVASAFAAVGFIGIVLALSLSLLNYALRFGRWQLYLASLGHPIAARPSLAIYLAGFSLTTTPGKAGEMLRGIFLKNRGVPYVRSTAAFLSERLSDLAAVVLITLPGLALYPQGRIFVVAGVAAVALAGLLISQGSALAWLGGRMEGHSSRLVKMARHLVLLLLEARRCHRPAMLLVATALSLAAWSAEAFAFHLVLGWTGIEVGLLFAMFTYALAMLAGALSFLPGGLGGAEAVMMALLLFKGAPEPQAIAATIVIRLTTLWFAVALGVAIMSIGQRKLMATSPEASA